MATIDLQWCKDHGGVAGIDISSYQKNVEWNIAKGSGVSFAIVKISEGKYGDIPVGYDLVNRCKEIQKQGIKLGYYHFARPGQVKIEDEIKIIRSMLGVLPIPDMDIFLDLESNGYTSQGQYGYSDWCRDFIKQYGKVNIYTSKSFLDKNLVNQDIFQGMCLWVSHYGVDVPAIPSGWSDWDIWQFWDKQNVDGVEGPCDIDIMKQEFFDKL